MTLGLLGFTVVILCTFAAFALLGLAYRGVYRRRLLREQADGVLLVAEANLTKVRPRDGDDQAPDGKPRPGMIRFRVGSVELAPKHGETMTVGAEAIRLVELAQLGLFPATQARFVLTSGTEFDVPITAPVAQVEQALLAV